MKKQYTMELQVIQSKIYEVRGYKVMLDFDLAEMYQVETRVLNQAVKRNIKRFPSDFMFQLTFEEWEILKSQFVTSSWGGSRKLPSVFTESGLAMLSQSLAELQARKALSDKPRRPVGYVQYNNSKKETKK